jgi:hypothetical protein
MADEQARAADRGRVETKALIGRSIALLLVLGPLIGVLAILKPWPIGLGMPMALIILGGFLSLGFLGLFIGPAPMAVATALLQAWRAVSVAPWPDEA